jgi:Domain of unknown function (DUF5666)
MKSAKASVLMFVYCALTVSSGSSLTSALPPAAHQSQDATGQNAVTRRIGTIKAINANSLTLVPDSGAEMNVTIQGSTRFLRIAPGETNLKTATPIQFQDLQVDDRILVGGRAAEDGKSIAASSVVVMKRSDVEARHQQELQDWQKRGVGGLVTAVDPSSGTVTVSVMGFGGAKTVAVRTSKSTVTRRYAPNSTRFDDAKISTLAEIRPGDQLRARGDRNADGTELEAEEIVSGSFRNLAGVVNSVDASTSTISVQDLLSKKNVQVKITQDSQLRTIPPEMAQRVAARLKGVGAAKPGSDSSVAAGTGPDSKGPRSTTKVGGQNEPAKMPMRSGGAPDFQQMLSRMPAMALSDLHKGDTVMIVATQGESSVPGTAITLLSGVDPILQAAPTANQAMLLTPWNLGGGPSGDANQ